MPRVCHFEIGADHPERAVEFYRQVFGWQAQKMEGPMDYWLLASGEPGQPGGINGGLMRRGEQAVPVINYIDVASIADSLAAVTDNSGQVVQGETPIPDMGAFALFTDPEGNLFGLVRMDRQPE